jgi:hypothetical protein
VDRLKTELAGFVGPAGWGDDVTTLVVKDKAPAAENSKEGLAKGADGVKVASERPGAEGAGLEYSIEGSKGNAGH